MNRYFFDIEKIYPPLLLLLVFICSSMLSLFAQPSGFSDELVIDGWAQAVGLTFDKNGRMYIWEKGGKVWTVDKGVKSAEPLIDISEEVGNWRDFGLVGFALDPNFLNNGYLYLWYVVDRHHLLNYGTINYNPYASSEKEATIARLTRYTANASDNFSTINLNSRKILIGESKSTGPPILHESHGAGQITFGTDGTLIVSIGDGASYANPADEGSHPSTYYQQALNDGIITSAQNIGAYRCQTLDNLSGKILRIDPNTGNGVPSNPYYQISNPRSPQSRIWSLGVRNPYRITLKPETGSHNANDGNPGTFFFGDVGWSTWEDLNVIERGGQNFGWPIYEGISQKTGYNHPNYQVSDAEHTHPKVDWRHGADQARAYINNAITNIGDGMVSGKQFRGNSSTGGVWYTGRDFPKEYQNTYFHADYSGGWIRNFGFDDNNNPTFVRDFKLNAGAVVFLNTSPIEDGLFYVRYPNQIRRITYTGNTNKKPIAILEADKTFGSSPLIVKFSAAQSFDPEYSSLSYLWDFGNNVTSTEINPSFLFQTVTSAPTTFPVTLTVRDEQGAESQHTIPISLNNTPPVIISTSLDNINNFDAKNGAILNLNAIVTDTEHSGQLKYEWQTALFHNGHSHAEPIDNNPSTTTTLSPIECDGSTYWFRVTLKVTDPKGLSTFYQKDIFPDCEGLPQTINCPPIPDQSITAGDIILNATATSGLPVSTYLLEGPAIIFGNKIVPSGLPGRVTIRITQGGNEAYRPATPIERSFNIVLPTNTACIAEGKITREIWNGGGQNTIDDIPVNTVPTESTTLNKFEVPSFSSAENAQRIRGFICPPQTGLYTFWIASDEYSQLWLSTNSDAGNKRLIASVSGNTRANQWNKYASQQSEPILLVAGSQYYVESLMNGGGHLSAGWKMPDNVLDRPISGQYLSPWKNKQNQTIAFFGIPDQLTTNPAFTIGANANSGLPVEFSIVSGPATVSGTTITLTGIPGTVIIRASQKGNDQFNPAPDVERKFEVTTPPTVPGITIDSPTNGSSFSDNNLTINYTLSGNLTFHQADHLLVSLDNQNPIDVHTLNGTYLLTNPSEGPHTVRMQLADNNHQPFTNPEATAIVNFSIIPSEKEQVINFFPISNKLTTDIPFTISANATSGLPVSLSIVSGPANMNGNQITLNGTPGIVTIVASQNGNEEYKAALEVTQSFEIIEPIIEKLNQSISFQFIPNKLTTDAPFEVIATASSGLPVSFIIESGPANVNGNLVTLTGIPGTVMIRAKQEGNSQYNSAIPFGRSFTVKQAEKQNQLITFPTITDKVTTDIPFPISASATSSLPVNFTIISGPATLAGNLITLTGETGTVLIRANQYGDSDYLPAPSVDRSFVVIEPTENVEESAQNYCTLISDFPWQEWIGQVTFGDLNNISSKEVYQLFEQSNATFSKGEIYSLKIVPAFSWTQWDEYIKVWIDFNQNGDFSDNGEEVLATISPAGIPLESVLGVSTNILIPVSAKSGQTRMRVAMQRADYPSICGTLPIGEVEDYLLTINGEDSSGNIEEQQPQSIDFPPITDQLTTTNSLILNASASSNLPVTYAILSGPATVNGNTLTLNGTAGTVVVTAIQEGNNQYFPAQSINRAFEIFSPENNGNTDPVITDYCEAKANSPWQEWIGNVSFGNINHNSSKEGYGNFTDIITTVNKGASYSISVSPSFSWTQWDEHINVWIDFNKNGRFDDLGEQVLSGISIAGNAQSLPQPVSGIVTIPSDASIGKTRMRVAMRQAEYASHCGSFEFGEIEDYSINITNTASSRTQSILTFSAYSNKEHEVDIEWVSNTDDLAKQYHVERSTDNLTFHIIKVLDSKYKNPKANFYFINDDSPLKGRTYYRVKQINLNGSFKYSNIVEMNRAFGLTDFYLFPNPVKDIINVHVKPFIGQGAHLKIYNSFGQLVKECKLDQVQTSLIQFDMQKEQNGMYFLYIKPKGRKEIGKKFILNRSY